MNSETGEFSIDLGFPDFSAAYGDSAPAQRPEPWRPLTHLRREGRDAARGSEPRGGHEPARGGYRPARGRSERAGFDPYNSTAGLNGNAVLDRNSAWARLSKR